MRAALCRSTWSMASAALVGLAMISAAGCSPVLASKQPSRRDVDLLSPGVPRNLVLAELGQPVAAETRDGRRVEVFSFVQGYRKGVKVARTIGHGAADVMTLRVPRTLLGDPPWVRVRLHDELRAPDGTIFTDNPMNEGTDAAFTPRIPSPALVPRGPLS